MLVKCVYLLIECVHVLCAPLLVQTACLCVVISSGVVFIMNTIPRPGIEAVFIVSEGKAPIAYELVWEIVFMMNNPGD